MRAASVNHEYGQFYQQPYGAYAGYGGYGNEKGSSRPGHQRGPSYGLPINNITAIAGKEILRSSVGNEQLPPSSRPDPKSTIEGSNVMMMPNNSDAKLNAPASWKDYISKQVNVANEINQNEKNDQKQRAMKYKETLDMMMQEEKKKKMESKKELLSGPTIDHSDYYTMMHMEKLKNEEERRKYASFLERQQKEREDIKARDEIRRQQEWVENQMRVNKMREFDQHQKVQDKETKKQIFDEYKNVMDERQNNRALQKTRFPEKEQLYFLNDNEREQLFEKIRSKGFPSMTAFNHLQEVERERKMKYDEFIGKQIHQKNGRDAEEAARKEEAFRRMQNEALTVNQQQIIDKNMLVQRKREEDGAQYKVYQENKKVLDEIDSYERNQVALQKRDYLEALKSQAQIQQQNRYNANELTSIEKAINFRKQDPYVSNDSSMNSLPFVGQSYERTKQLKYLDNWLNFLPK